MNNHVSKRKLLLHIGGSKTGSTAIQNFLYQNRSALLDKSISYEEFDEPSSGIQSGNGQSLFNLVRNGGTNSEIRKQIQLFCRRGELSIISSEFFQLWSLENWKSFFRCTRDLEIELKLLLYVRSPVDFIVSSYIQDVKRSGFFSDLETYIPKRIWLHAEVLKNLCNLGHQEKVTVVSYDDHRSQLIDSFFNFVSILFGTEEFHPFTSEEANSNRSLDQKEINLIRETNRLFDGKYAQLLSDFLIQEFPSSGTEFRLTKRALEILSSTYQEEVIWMNQTFFEGKDIVQVHSNRFLLDDHLTNLQHNEDSYPDQAVLVQVIFYLLRNIEKESTKLMMAQIRETLQQISKFEYLEEMDDGKFFDGVYYSILNPDVISANYSPLEHFNSWGKLEGRSWRSFNLRKTLSRSTQAQSSQLEDEGPAT